jgi:hypothetical protein
VSFFRSQAQSQRRLHSARSFFDFAGGVGNKSIVQCIFGSECPCDLIVEREDAIEVSFSLSHEGFDLPAIFRRIRLFAKVSELIFATAHVLLPGASSVHAAFNRWWTSRRL